MGQRTCTDELASVLHAASSKILLKSTLLLASAYGVLDPAQLYANVILLAAALWFTYRYFTEVWPNREKVYVPEPWKGD